LIDVNRCKVTIPYVKDERYGIEALSELTSPSLTITDTVTGRRLEFTVKVLSGGMLNDLVGFAADGQPWPLDWCVDDAELVGSGVGLTTNWLPAVMSESTRSDILRRLAAWSDTDPVRLNACGEDLLRVSPPASHVDIAAAEERLGLSLPRVYHEFVSICDGFSIRHGRPYDVLGTRDVYRLDTDAAENPCIVITVLYEEGVVALDLAGRAVLHGSHALQPETIGTLKVHVHDSLCWLEEIQ
jgi:hypothetical protein